MIVLVEDVISEFMDCGGYLVMVIFLEENDFLISVLGSNNVWIGFIDWGIEGDFIWEMGEVVNFINWCLGELNDLFDEDYVELNVE